LEDGIPQDAPPFKENLKAVVSEPSFWCIALGYAAYTATLQGFSAFGPTFFEALAVFEDEATCSLVFGGMVFLGGIIGTPLGGYITSKTHSGSIPDYVLALRMMVVCSAIGTALMFGAVFLSQATHYIFMALLFMALTIQFAAMPAISIALLGVTPPACRALVIALDTFIMHLLGDVPSPIAIGWLKDHLAPDCGVVDQGGLPALDPRCGEDADGLQWTMFWTVAWLCWAVLFWTLAYFRELRKSSRLSQWPDDMAVM
jgi:sugar phosphate permease